MSTKVFFQSFFQNKSLYLANHWERFYADVQKDLKQQ